MESFHNSNILCVCMYVYGAMEDIVLEWCL